MYTLRDNSFHYHYNWQFERPVQVLPTLREMFFLTDMSIPEYTGFVGSYYEISEAYNFLVN